MTELKLTFKLNIFCQPILGQDNKYPIFINNYFLHLSSELIDFKIFKNFKILFFYYGKFKSS